ncbi:MAG: 2-oxo acid dehydrogenase subunit E2 [Clostridia bacterium]|nr:2-oxo acid dehydrogenase subunit E2 [Clostridia bacterium]
MATAILMPKQGQSVESCIIAKWHKNEGDSVAVGDVLFTYETDKATFDEEAKEAGTMLGIFFEEGDDIPCLTPVCAIGNPGEDISALKPASEDDAPAAEAAPAAVEAAPVAAAAPVEVKAVAADNVFISPRAKALANKHNVDYHYAAPTGPNGRVIERDVQAMIDAGLMTTPAASGAYSADIVGTGIGGRISVNDIGAPAAAPAAASAAPVADFEEVKTPNIRKVIAKTMHASLSEMAQLTLNASFDATEIMAYRSKVKANMEKLGLANITLNDLVMYAVAKTLPNHKDCNAHYLGDTIKYFNNVHLGMAVDTPRGLLVPTIFNANNMSLNDIANAAKDLAGKCKDGTATPDMLTGGSFTVTNLGSMGIESFTPVINPPQTCILGVCTIETKVKNVGGEYKYYPSMGLSLTFDHRALDGSPAARFLKELCTNLENFSVLLSK